MTTLMYPKILWYPPIVIISSNVKSICGQYEVIRSVHNNYDRCNESLLLWMWLMKHKKSFEQEKQLDAQNILTSMKLYYDVRLNWMHYSTCHEFQLIICMKIMSWGSNKRLNFDMNFDLTVNPWWGKHLPPIFSCDRHLWSCHELCSRFVPQ